ncbi:MAG: hypothetical protein QNJ46_10975 [Leptolyngbyaceae cyanobacterium MO_188.B28]|nr:hypothetical protein [Leptolyngbyaceae cyanobacterium MO_188.B28]
MKHSCNTALDRTFHLYQQERPVAVVKPDGRLIDRLESAHVLTCMG